MIAALSPEPGLHIERSLDIAAPLQIVWETVLDQLGPASEMPDGSPFPMKIEPWPGGRWYRDLGNNAGHFWGHVQVIKPPSQTTQRPPRERTVSVPWNFSLGLSGAMAASCS